MTTLKLQMTILIIQIVMMPMIFYVARMVEQLEAEGNEAYNKQQEQKNNADDDDLTQNSHLQ